MKKNYRYQVIPQMEIYDNLGFEWLPFLMFTQMPNYRSKVVNTDSKGFRFNFKEDIEKNNVFNIDEDKKNILVLGNSTAFGVGSTNDEATITSNLSDANFNYINLAGRAHVGFQELISLFSNFDQIKKIEKVIILSGVNDFYLSDILKINYPDNFYFNTSFIQNMNNSRINASKKIAKFFLDIFYPNVLNDKNIWRLNKSNFFDFIQSSNFRKYFKSFSKFPNLKIEEKFNRNFSIYNSLQNFFNCKVEYYLQPVLHWSKEMNDEEKHLYDYSNIYLSKISKQAFKLFTNEKYLDLTNLISRLSKNHGIDFFDTNLYFKDVLKKSDWTFVDAVHCTDQGYKSISTFIKSNN